MRHNALVRLTLYRTCTLSFDPPVQPQSCSGRHGTWLVFKIGALFTQPRHPLLSTILCQYHRSMLTPLLDNVGIPLKCGSLTNAAMHCDYEYSKELYDHRRQEVHHFYIDESSR